MIKIPRWILRGDLDHVTVHIKAGFKAAEWKQFSQVEVMLRRRNIEIVKTDLAVELRGYFTQLQRVRGVGDVELKDFDLFAAPKLASLCPLNANDQILLDQIRRQLF